MSYTAQHSLASRTFNFLARSFELYALTRRPTGTRGRFCVFSAFLDRLLSLTENIKKKPVYSFWKFSVQWRQYTVQRRLFCSHVANCRGWLLYSSNCAWNDFSLMMMTSKMATFYLSKKTNWKSCVFDFFKPSILCVAYSTNWTSQKHKHVVKIQTTVGITDVPSGNVDA